MKAARYNTKCRRHRAALLLEVVVALTIMVGALGVLGAQLVTGLKLTRAADQRSRAAALVDRLISLVEYDPQMQEHLLVEESTDGDFGEQYPGWFWEVEFEPIEQVEALGRVYLRVLFQENPDRIDSPDDARLMRQVVLLKAERGRINLVEDFGVTEEQVAELTDLFGMLEFDPTSVDPQELMQMVTQDPEILMQILPTLMPLLQQYFGDMGGQGDLEGLIEDQLGGAGGLLGDGADGGMSLEDLQGLADELGGAGAPSDKGDDAGGAPPATGGRRGGATPGRGNRGGARQGSGTGAQQGAGSGQSRYTIEDLMRLRDELQQGGG